MCVQTLHTHTHTRAHTHTHTCRTPTPQISEGQRNQIIEHIRRYNQAVPRAPVADADSDAGSDRFTFDEPAVDEVCGWGRAGGRRG